VLEELWPMMQKFQTLNPTAYEKNQEWAFCFTKIQNECEDRKRLHAPLYSDNTVQLMMGGSAWHHILKQWVAI